MLDCTLVQQTMGSALEQLPAFRLMCYVRHFIPILWLQLSYHYYHVPDPPELDLILEWVKHHNQKSTQVTCLVKNLWWSEMKIPVSVILPCPGRASGHSQVVQGHPHAGADRQEEDREFQQQECPPPQKDWKRRSVSVYKLKKTRLESLKHQILVTTHALLRTVLVWGSRQ